MPKTGTRQEELIIDDLVLFLENLCLPKMGMEPQARQTQAREARRERAPDHHEVEHIDHDDEAEQFSLNIFIMMRMNLLIVV